MDVYGHRGARAHAPENTVAAIERALADDAAGVEVDVRRTADDVLVLAHDAYAGTAEIVRSEAEQLALPRLVDVLDVMRGRGRVILEVKNIPGEPDFDGTTCRTAELLVQALSIRGPGDDVVVSSFDWHSIERVHAAGLRTGFLLPPGIALPAGTSYAAGAGHAEIHPHWSSVVDESAAVAAAHDAGLRVVCWTVLEADVARTLLAAGVDAVIADDPAGVLAALAGPA